MHLPVLMLSTAGDPITVSIARRLGANGYLIKPYSYPALCTRLAMVLEEDFSTPKSDRDTPFLQLLDAGKPLIGPDRE